MRAPDRNGDQSRLGPGCSLLPSRSPDQAAGEVPKAFVVLRAPASADELMAWVAERVAPYKRIRRTEFTDHIPTSPSGKILRRLLIERDRQLDDEPLVPRQP
jgi:acyl-coenzyme A synthetase/AMP-(fatty) acid ligase